jgi:hypothetical protein
LGGLTGFLGGSSNADIGWIPLAPGEQYQPWYAPNYSYPQTALTTVPNVTNIYNYYTNAQYYGGMSVVPVSAWRTGNFRRVVVMRPQQVKRIVLIRAAVPVVPTTANLHYTTVTTVRHPIVLSRTFAAPRLAAKAPSVTHISFKTQQAKIETIARVKPKVVALPPRHVMASHPVYREVRHAPVHVTVIKPVTKPVTVHHVAPAAKPAPKPEPKPAPKTAPVHHAASATKPAAKPVPVAKPVMVHREAPVTKPVVHPATPVAKPVVHPATPAAKPVVHPVTPQAKPATRPATPVVKPQTHPATPANAHANEKPHEPHPKPTSKPER